MSNLKFSENAFLEKQELNRFKKFIFDDGFKSLFKKQTFAYGIVKELDDPSFLNFKVQQGTNSGTFKLTQDSYAIDSDLNIITKKAEDNIAIPNDNAFYWIKISHELSPNEAGLVSVDGSGVVTGVGTEFETVLRGQPNFPSKIAFVDSSLNTLEYEVATVISDTSLQLQGSFSAESNLTYKVVGTFVPGSNPSSGQKDLFQYSSCDLELVAEASTNVPPAKTDGLEFYIARIRNNAGVLTIQDKRTEVWKLKSDFDISTPQASDNALIGVESIKWNSVYSPRDKNVIDIAWGMRSSNWTIDSAVNLLTINAGVGGKFKRTSDFTDGDFDGWRVYNSVGGYSKIVSSAKVSTQINLVLDYLNVDDFTASTEITIVPDCEEIQIKFSQDASEAAIELIDRVFTYPIRQSLASIEIIVPGSTYDYNITYRHKTLNDYSVWNFFPNDSVGYFSEPSFTALGVLDANPANHVIVPYNGHISNGYITFTLATNAYFNRLNNIESGDLFGVSEVVISNSTPTIPLLVGSQSQNQIFSGTVTLSLQHVINLRTTGAIAGNAFFLKFTADIDLDGQDFYIAQDYNGVGVPTNILITFDEFYVAASKAEDLYFYFLFDGTNWVVNEFTNKEYTRYTDASSVVSFKKIEQRTIEIGTWNMNSDLTKSITFGNTLMQSLRSSLSIVIQNDGDYFFFGFYDFLSNGGEFSFDSISSYELDLEIPSAGFFNSNSQFNSNLINRGWISFLVEV